jgi:hypothetical protein
MKTRSQTKAQTQRENTIQNLYLLNIDFDNASECWKKNKKYIGNGCYNYVCDYTSNSNKICGKKCYKQLSFCYIHRNKATK